jgi:hypothetical protein
MKKTTLLSLITVLTMGMEVPSIDLNEGWNNIGALYDVNVSLSFSDSSINAVWKYDRDTKSWKLFTPSNNYGSFEKLDNLKKGEGFWININYPITLSLIPETNTTVLDYNITDMNLSLKKGWQNIAAFMDIYETSFNNSNIKSVWRYENGVWSVYFPNNPEYMDILPQDISPLTTISKGAGIWVKALNDITVNITKMDDIYQYLSKYVDTPQDFELSDIANKTFKIRYCHSYNQCSFENISFDSNGKASKEINGHIYNFYFDNGSIKAVSDIEEVTVKKLFADENGIVVEGVSKDLIYHYSNGFIDLLLKTEPNPVDMESKLPYTVYYEYNSNSYTVFEANHTVSNYTYNPSTKSYELDYSSGEYNTNTNGEFSIEDGAIVIHNDWSYYENINGNDTNVSYKYYTILQQVAKVGRYNMIDGTYKDVKIYRDENLSGKDWNYIIDNNISIFTYNFLPDGNVSWGYDSVDGNLTYTINDNIATVIHKDYNYDYNYTYEYNETIKLDENGTITDEYKHENDYLIGSNEPILKPGSYITSYRKSSKKSNFNHSPRLLPKH